MLTLKDVQTEITDTLTRHLKDHHVAAQDFDGAVWVQVNEKWAVVEPVMPNLPGRRPGSFKIKTGFEAGYDMAGGEPIEPNEFYVSGLQFGVVPKVLSWVDRLGRARK